MNTNDALLPALFLVCLYLYHGIHFNQIKTFKHKPVPVVKAAKAEL